MISNKLEGVVFDLDGTLVNFGGHINWKEAQSEIFQVYLSCGCTKDDINNCINMGVFSTIDMMQKNLASFLDKNSVINIQQDIWEILDKYERDGIQKCELINGSQKILSQLNNNKLKLGICTSNSTFAARSILMKFNIDNYFSSIVGRTRELKMKPFPDQVIKCFEKMNVLPERGVMIGDSLNDIIAGKSAGAKTIAIPMYFTKLDELHNAKPDFIIHSIAELPNALKALN